MQREKSVIKWGIGVLEEGTCLPEIVETWVFAGFSVFRLKSGVKRPVGLSASLPSSLHFLSLRED